MKDKQIFEKYWNLKENKKLTSCKILAMNENLDIGLERMLCVIVDYIS